MRVSKESVQCKRILHPRGNVAYLEDTHIAGEMCEVSLWMKCLNGCVGLVIVETRKMGQHRYKYMFHEARIPFTPLSLSLACIAEELCGWHFWIMLFITLIEHLSSSNFDHTYCPVAAPPSFSVSLFPSL